MQIAQVFRMKISPMSFDGLKQVYAGLMPGECARLLKEWGGFDRNGFLRELKNFREMTGDRLMIYLQVCRFPGSAKAQEGVKLQGGHPETFRRDAPFALTVAREPHSHRVPFV